MPKIWKLDDQQAQSVSAMLTHGGKNPDSGAEGIVVAGGLLMSLRMAPAEDPEVAKLREQVAKLEGELKSLKAAGDLLARGQVTYDVHLDDDPAKDRGADVIAVDEEAEAAQ